MIHYLIQEIEEGVFKIIDKSNDYEELYLRVNNETLRDENKKLMIVELKHIFNPAKQSGK